MCPSIARRNYWAYGGVRLQSHYHAIGVTHKGIFKMPFFRHFDHFMETHLEINVAGLMYVMNLMCRSSTLRINLIG